MYFFVCGNVLVAWWFFVGIYRKPKKFEMKYMTVLLKL